MDRRALIAGTLALLAAPLVAAGQTPGHLHRVGIIHEGGVYQVEVDGLRQGLRVLGLEEGTHWALPQQPRNTVRTVLRLPQMDYSH